jgi:secondary thiamine-phosphate synthase enzyme
MESISIKTGTRTEFVDITAQIQQQINKTGLKDGTVFVYVPHTTAGVTINEGADQAVKRDILSVLNHLIPWDFNYQHLEGNSPAHIKASVMGSGVHIIVEDGKLCLGTWQRVFFCEFDGPRNRKIWLKAMASRG